ncbi:hypothetical protein AN643_03950 [Candidatus Epulonipiscioides saccharophilum]|nr:hypothetical protein AN643_03950 [Epulopiscium sp. SCG-B10WGA-EpuloB]
MLFGGGARHFNTPKHIGEAAKEAIDNGFTRYTPASGILQLKKAVAKKFLGKWCRLFAPTIIVVSRCQTLFFINAFMASKNYLDEVILPAPYWLLSRND